MKSCKTTAKKCAKKVCCSCKVAFLLIRPIVVFFSPFSLCLYTEPGLGPTLFPGSLEEGFRGNHARKVPVRVRVRLGLRLGLGLGLGVGKLGLLFVALILLMFISLLRTLLIL